MKAVGLNIILHKSFVPSNYDLKPYQFVMGINNNDNILR